MNAPSLEQKIAAALTGNVTSSSLAALIAKTEAAITRADATVSAERERALDPTLSPDAKAAREAMQAAEFSRERLRTVLPRLRNRLRQVQAAEYTAQWRRDFERVEVKRDTLASEFAELYPKLVAQLIDLFRRVEAVDSECSRVNGSAPANQNRYLFGVELSARNLESFTITSPSIAQRLQLPDIEHSDRMAWPLPQPSLAAAYAMSMLPQHDRRSTADWAAAQEEDKARRAANEARWDEEEAARQAASRRSYETNASFVHFNLLSSPIAPRVSPFRLRLRETPCRTLARPKRDDRAPP
jgi:hypothetical protein